MKELMTIKEVHALIPAHCDGYAPSLRTVENLRRSCQLRSTKRGGRVFYKRANVLKFFGRINSGKS